MNRRNAPRPRFQTSRRASSGILASTPFHTDDVVGILPPMHREATIELVAVNAAMAGCEAWGMPYVIAGLVADVDARKPEHVPQESAVGLGPRAVEDRMCTDDHESSSPPDS